MTRAIAATVFALVAFACAPTVAEESMDELTTQTLANALASADSSKYLLFDEREPAEFELSHVHKAFHVEPDAKQEAFVKEFGEELKDKHLIFFCSVGCRRSVLASVFATVPWRQGLCRWPTCAAGSFVGTTKTELSTTVRPRRTSSTRMTGVGQLSSRGGQACR